MLVSELRINVLDAFSALTQSLSDLCAAIKSDSAFIAWTQNDSNFFSEEPDLNPREKTIKVLNQLEYIEHQAGRDIIVCAGFICASDSTLKLALRVNECKDLFKKSILSLKKIKIDHENNENRVLTEKIDSTSQKHLPIRQALQQMGLARLHLKQCYRKIPILPHAPQKISWTWAHTRAIQKISVCEAKKRLEKRGRDVGIQMQLQKLAYLNSHEPLAIVQELAPHLRANIVFNEENIEKRTMIKGPIPIFFPGTAKTPYPSFTPPYKKQGRNQNRSLRSDVRLDPVPYLPAIRTHRYINPPDSEPSN